MSLNVNSPGKRNNRRIFDSDMEAIKTKEFQRRRLLRLQQVREQSRDMAKKVRERAENEHLRQIARIDQTKSDTFKQSRDKVVNELRNRCSDNIQHLGAGHSDAARETIARKEEENRRRSNDKSCERAKSAASLLRQSKHLLEESKEKTLQRKLQARSLANERSRQNVNKLKSSKQVSDPAKRADHDLVEVIKSADGKVTSATKDTTSIDGKGAKTQNPGKHATEMIVNYHTKTSSISSAARKSSGKDKDMEWPSVEGANAKPHPDWMSNPDNRPSHDKPNAKEVSVSADKRRRDLFTVSEEMPSNLRGGIADSATSSKMESTIRQSINMVSNYLHDRAKRLPNTTTKSGFNRVSGEEMQSLKETIIRSKKLDFQTANSGGVIESKTICQVTDSQAIPMPSWKPVVVRVFDPVPDRMTEERAESPVTLNMNFDEFGSRIIDDEKYNESDLHDPIVNTRQSPARTRGSLRSPPSHRSPVATSRISVAKSGKSTGSRKSKQSTTSSTKEARHNIVTQYDHRTRAVTDVPRGDTALVKHHEATDHHTDDAFTLAARESAEVVGGSAVEVKEGRAERRSGDAEYKQKVEREYRDMIRSLKGVTKEKGGGAINSAFMDDTRQMMVRATQQRKMAEEFEKVQRENEARKSVGPPVTINIPAKQRPSRNQERRSHQPPKGKTMQAEKDNYRTDSSPAKRVPTVTVDSNKQDSSKARGMKDSRADNVNNRKDASPTKAVKNVVEVATNKQTTHKQTTSPKSVIVRNQSTVKFNLKYDKSSSNMPTDYYYGKEEDSDRKYSTDLSDKVHEINDNSESDVMTNLQKPPDKPSREGSDSPHLGRGDLSNSEFEDGDSDQARSEPSNTGSKGRQAVVKRKVRAAQQPARRFARTSSLESKRNVCEADNDTNHHQKIHKRPTKESHKKHHTKRTLSTNRDVSNSASDELYNLMAGIVERRAKDKRDATTFKGRGQAKTTGRHGQDRKVLDWDVGACEVGSTTDDQSSRMVPKNPITSAIHPCPTWLLMNHNVKCIHISKSNLKNDSTPAATQPSISPTTSAATFKTACELQETKTHKAEVQKESQDKSPTTCITKNINISSDNRQSLDGFEVVIQLKKKTGKPTPKDVPIPGQVSNFPLRLGSFSSSSSTAYMSPPEKIVPKLLSVNTLNVLAEKNNNIQEKGPLRTYEDLDKKPTQDKCPSCDGKQTDGGKEIAAQKTEIIESKKTTSVASVQTENLEKKPDSNDIKCSCEKFERRKRSPCLSSCRGTSSESKGSQKLSKENKSEKPLRKSAKKTSEPRTRTVYHKPIKYRATEKARLNPEIRKYIDELLELGREGIQDLEVTNSTVTTPCNSIINIPSNRSIADQYEENKRRAKINEYLKKNEGIFNALMLDNGKSDPNFDLQTVIIQNRYPVPQESAKRPSKMLSSKTPVSNDIDEVIKQVIVKAKPKIPKAKPKVVVNTGRRRLKSIPLSKNLNKYFKNSDSKVLKKSVYFMPALRFTTSEIIKSKSTKQRKLVAHNRSRTFPIKDLRKSDMSNEKSPQSTAHNLADNFIKAVSPKRTVNKSSMTTNVNCVNKLTSVNNLLEKNFSTQTPETHTGSKIFNNLIDNMKVVNNEQTDVPKDRSSRETAGINKMEKFADLTQKCTKRLSTLVKVLDEVRKNKMNIFNDILGPENGVSEDGIRKAPPNIAKPPEPSPARIKSSNKFFLLPNSVDDFGENINRKKMENFIPFLSDLPKPEESKARMNDDFRESSSRESIKSSTDSNKSLHKTKPPPAMTRITLKNAPELIPHELSTVMEVDSPLSIRTENISRDRTPIVLKFGNEKSESSISINIKSTSSLSPVAEHESDRQSSETKTSIPKSRNPIKSKSKEPSLKDLSKQSVEISLSKSKEPSLKDLSEKISTSDSKEPSLKNFSEFSGNAPEIEVEYRVKQVPSPVTLPQPERAPAAKAENKEPEDLMDDIKFSMMDVDKFKEIMMKPFITYEEYARQCNKSDREEKPLGDDSTPTPKAQSVREEISSINSEGTLPDIIAELLKRNIIDEPFAFNMDSKATSSLSSLTDSSVSLVDSSKNYKKEKLISSSKKNKSEKDSKHGDSEDSHSSRMTKVSLSESSQADLEVVLEKLGMCWASSTLKKTKQSLALSSSSSSSKNIMERKSQMASFQKVQHQRSLLKEISRLMNSNSDINSILVDIFNDTSSVSSTQNVPDDGDKENFKITEATNTVTSNMTQTDEKKVLSVKDYLTKEMADKITFSNQMSQNDSNNEHFTSLYSTKLTNLYKSKVEDLKNEECSGDRNRSRSRQRTSTPVQLFKSLTYNSSSSSCNNSNGLFSNVEDLSSVKAQSQSVKNSSVTDKDELTIPNLSLKAKKSSSISS